MHRPALDLIDAVPLSTHYYCYLSVSQISLIDEHQMYKVPYKKHIFTCLQ
jgi:hypothetical protein